MTRSKTSLAIMLFSIIIALNYGQSQPVHNLLRESYPLSELKNILIPYQDFNFFPTWQERDSWLALADEVRRELISRGERYLNYQWPSLPATLFLDFARTGNRENFERSQGARREALTALVIAECTEGKGRFLNDIVNGIWTICEESYWGLPAHLSLQSRGIGLPDVLEPTVDLIAAETGSLLAWTVYLIGSQLDNVSPLIRARIQGELEKRILTPCLKRDDFWWMGFQPDRTVNNWNPWINSNWLAIVLLTEQDKTKRLEAISKIMQSLDVFIDGYPPDGSCDEGAGYWNRAAASLFDCLELLYSATNGEIDIYNEPKIQEMGRYIYRMHIANRYFINFADAPARVSLESDLTYRYGKRIGDKLLQLIGAFFAQLQRKDGNYFNGSISRQLAAIFNYDEIVAANPAQPLTRDVWLEGIQVMAARDRQGSPEGLYVAAQGGHNAESHNHNDVGNFIIYFNGLPMIIDVGVERYTKKTFSAQRYEIWTMQSAYHNLPTIDDVMQKDGLQFAAKDVEYSFDNTYAQLRINIAGAYPPEAGINNWIHTIRLNRGKEILVTDAFDLNKEAQKIELTLMTACEVALDEPGKITLQYINKNPADSTVTLYVFFDARKLTPKLEQIPINDKILKTMWGDKIMRILLRANSSTIRDSWTLRITQ